MENVVGKRIIVSVSGFGSREGVIDKHDPKDHPHNPYHVFFQAAAEGWFDDVECGFINWVEGPQPGATSLNHNVDPNNPQNYTFSLDLHGIRVGELAVIDRQIVFRGDVDKSTQAFAEALHTLTVQGH